MKTRPVVIVFCAALLSHLLPDLGAAEQLKLEPALYVFKDSAFSTIKIGADRIAEPGRGIAFIAPVAFDRDILALKGAEYSWNGGSKAPAAFSLVTTTVITTGLAEPAAVLSALPMQYLEKSADETLQLREIPRDSPDVPHYRLTFNVRALEAAATDLDVSCQLDMATMKGRENIPGVTLETGRPILARFKENFRFKSSAGEWSGLVVRNPGGSDYSVLLLLKISPADGQNAIDGAVTRLIGTAASGESGLAASLEIFASDSIELKLDWDRRTRREKLAHERVKFRMTLKGKGPVYREFEIHQDGATTPVPHRGTVTLGPKQEWVSIDLQEIVSKAGETVRAEPCLANGKYAVEGISNGADLYPPSTRVQPSRNPAEEGPLRGFRIEPSAPVR